jgi:hypothetical protein
MKVGSLVELMKDGWMDPNVKRYNIKTPVTGIIYVVRDIERCRLTLRMGLRLEEIVNEEISTLLGLMEPTFSVERFREIQPPMDLSELLENNNKIQRNLFYKRWKSFFGLKVHY